MTRTSGTRIIGTDDNARPTNKRHVNTVITGTHSEIRLEQVLIKIADRGFHTIGGTIVRRRQDLGQFPLQTIETSVIQRSRVTFKAVGSEHMRTRSCNDS